MKLRSVIILIILTACPTWANEISCDPVTQKAHYNNSTGSWECKTDQTGGGGGAVFSVFGRTGDVLAAADDYSWTQIASKPSTFPPDAHGHAEADVTNLVTDLGAKVPTSRRIDTTTPLQGGDNLTADRTFSILQAGSGQSGYLSSTHWSLFNAKENALSFSTPLSRSIDTITCPTCSVSGHAHAEADVTSLVTDLAGKSAVGHGHAEADVTNLVSDLAAKETTANKNAASGYAGLDASSKLTGAQQVYGTGANTAAQGNDSRITGAEQTANKNAASGYAGLDASTKLAAAQLPNPGASTLGGVKSLTCSGTDKLSAIGTDGLPICGADQGAGAGAGLTRIAGASGAAGADITWQRLTANSANQTSVSTPAVVMTTTGVGAGTWRFRYTLIYQTAVTTTGIGIFVNHTGTTGQFASTWNQADTSATASTAVGVTVTTAAAGGVYDAKTEAVINTLSTASISVGVVTANSDVLAILQGIVVVTATGSLELKIRTEVDTSAVRIMADSMLELLKIG